MTYRTQCETCRSAIDEPKPRKRLTKAQREIVFVFGVILSATFGLSGLMTVMAAASTHVAWPFWLLPGVSGAFAAALWRVEFIEAGGDK